MHISDLRQGRTAKSRKQQRSSRHAKITCKVLKKFKVDRKNISTDRASLPEPINTVAYEDSAVPPTIKAFLEASNRKKPSCPTQTPVKKVQVDEIPSEKDQNEENVYCDCKRPYSHGELMFKCEGFCEGWYHPECLKMKPEEVERQAVSNERWYCPTCIYQAQQIVLDTTSKFTYKKVKNNV